MRPSRVVLAALGAVTALGVVACVEIPADVAATFAPARPEEPSRYRRRDDAPGPRGFVDAAAGGALAADGGVS
jgi:hypothetical protein